MSPRHTHAALALHAKRPRDFANAMHLVASIAWLAAASLFAGCTLSSGHPWGSLDVNADASWTPASVRLDALGRLLTSQDYAIDVDSAVVTFDALEYQLSENENSIMSFDPANPPAGYSLCHGGHCHNDNGALVSYSDIQNELDGVPSSFVVRSQDISPVGMELWQQSPKLHAKVCSDDCMFPRGVLTRVAVRAASM